MSEAKVNELKKSLENGAVPIGMSPEGANRMINELVGMVQHVVESLLVVNKSLTSGTEEDKKVAISLTWVMAKTLPEMVAHAIATNSTPLTKEEAERMVTRDRENAAKRPTTTVEGNC